MFMSQSWVKFTLAASLVASAGVGLMLSSLADALVLPAPMASSHNVLLRSDARRERRCSVAASAQRVGYVCLHGPLNFKSMDLQAGIAGGVPDPVNITTMADPTSTDVMEWADAAGAAARAEGGAYLASFDLSPRDLPLVEENVQVIESPEKPVRRASQEKQDHPSISKIVQFSLPAIGVWLCSPVLSMIDTASVGLLAGTAQQAALNPAVSVTDYGAILVAFMYTATTNLIAGAVEKDLADGAAGADQPRTKRTMVTALRLALLVGVTLGAILGSAAPLLLRMLIGNSSLDPIVFRSALRYVQIRSLGMPAAVVIGTAQSACLGMKDVKSPLYVLVVAAVINLLGDMLLVRNTNPWLGGAAGAAWATVISQYGALVLFMRWLTVTSKKRNDSVESMDPMKMIKATSKRVRNSIKVTFGHAYDRGTVLGKKLFSSSNQPTVKNKSQTEISNDALAKGFLSRSHKPSSILNPLRLVESKSTINEFLPFVVPVTTTSIGRISGFVTMSHIASSALGTCDMAAHQIAISIFYCLSPVVDALSQVAQSFVPGIFARERSRARAVALRKTSINFAKVGALFGSSIAAAIALGVPVVSRFFTTDPLVLSRIKNAIPGIAVFLGFDGLMCIGEGSLLGQNDLKFLRNSYASFFFLVPAFMLRLKRRALNGIEVGIGALWGTFSIYEVVRTTMWLGRLVWLQRQTERQVDEMEAVPVII